MLKQFELVEPPVFHRFVVFSIVNDDGSFKPSYAVCNHCGAVHRVTEVGVSTQLRRETAPTVLTIPEIKLTLPEKLVELLLPYERELDLPWWQELKFIYDNEKWGKTIVLAKERDDLTGDVSGKYLLLAGKTLWKVDSFSTEDM